MSIEVVKQIAHIHCHRAAGMHSSSSSSSSTNSFVVVVVVVVWSVVVGLSTLYKPMLHDH